MTLDGEGYLLTADAAEGTEVWRMIDGWDMYEVSSHGRVRRWQKYKRYTILKPNTGGRGTDNPHVTLQNKPQKLEQAPIHKLVALAFMGPCPPGMYLCKIDGDLSNNSLDNLEYRPRHTDSTEKWLPVEGWPYEVSNCGNVMRFDDPYFPPVLLRPHSSKVSRHMCVVLTNGKVRKTRMVHQLVAGAFIGPCPEGQVVNHLDGNATNLEYTTRAGNNKHAAEMGLTCRGERHHWTKLSDDDVREIRMLYATGLHSNSDLGRLFGVSGSHISGLVRRDKRNRVT